jgi:hypothetical protein
LGQHESFFEMSSNALTKKKEKELVEAMYNDINEIDNVLGLLECQLNLKLELEMDQWIHTNILKLEKSKMNQYYPDIKQLQTP